MQTDEDLISTKEASEILGESKFKTLRRVKAGELPHVTKLAGLRGSFILSRQAVDVFAAKLGRAPADIANLGDRSAGGASASDTTVWIPVVDFEGYYEVSENGDVRRIAHGGAARRGHILSQATTPQGYRVVRLSRDGVAKTHSVHRIVARAFHGEPADSTLYARHLDGDQTNNHKSNLAWGTPSENSADKAFHAQHGIGAVRPSESEVRRAS